MHLQYKWDESTQCICLTLLSLVSGSPNFVVHGIPVSCHSVYRKYPQFHFYQVASSLAQNGSLPPNHKQERDNGKEEEEAKEEDTMLSEVKICMYCQEDNTFFMFSEIFHKKKKWEEKNIWYIN